MLKGLLQRSPELYQSGTTLWSYAKNLKLAGATTVIGLVCVKTSRDTDNQ